MLVRKLFDKPEFEKLFYAVSVFAVSLDKIR